MRKIISALIAVLSSCLVYSQDTSIVNYYPTAVGNVWIYHYNGYNGCQCDLVSKTQIISQININGEIYNIFKVSVSNVNGSQCPTPSIDTMRVDSVTGNILKYTIFNIGCYTPHVKVIDSLRSRINDILRSCGTHQSCTDTSLKSIFGLNKPSKTFGYFSGSYNWSRVYVKDFGYTSNTYSPDPSCYTQNTLLGCVINGIVYGDTSFPVAVGTISNEIPENFQLYQNYPNPFNPKTIITYDIPTSSVVNLIVYDCLGNEIICLVNNDYKQSGRYSVEFNGEDLASGVYVCKIQAGEYIKSKKMVLIK